MAATKRKPPAKAARKMPKAAARRKVARKR